MGNIELVFPVLSTTHSIHTSLKYSSSCEILVSPTFAGDAGDHSQEGKSFSCTTAGQGKTTASNGLGCDFSWACYFFSFLFFTSPFHLMPLQNKMTPVRTNENLIIPFFLSLFFFVLFSFGQAAYLQPVRRLCRSHWRSPPCPSFLFLLIASVAGKGAILQPRSPLLLFTGLWPLTCDRRGCSGSIFIKNQWLSSVFRCAVCVCLCW